MANKLQTLSLDDLYSKSKITPAVAKQIILKTDFSTIDTRYCENVCKLKCKNPHIVSLTNREVDIAIIQDHGSPPQKFRSSKEQEAIQKGVINTLTKLAGFGNLSYSVLNLLKCEPTEEDFPEETPPTQTTLQKCFPYLKQELLIAKPKVIISLGTATTKMLGLPKKSNTGNRGEICITPFGPVVLSLHPRILSFIRQNARGSAGMWGADYLKVIQRDFEKARDIATGKFKFDENTFRQSVSKLEKERIILARSLDDVKRIVDIINSLNPDSIIAFDTETTSLDPLSPTLKILMIQFGWRDPLTNKIVAGVIPLYHRENNYYNPDEAWALVEPILLGPRAKVGHNSKYDVLVIYFSKGIRVNNVLFDSLLLLHSEESGIQGCYGLKTACWDHLYMNGYAGYEDDLGDLKNLKLEEATDIESVS